MIIYEATKTEFISDITNELLIERLYQSYQEKIGRTSKSEITSWENSLQANVQMSCRTMESPMILR